MRNYLEHMILPAGVKFYTDRLRVKDSKPLPAFGKVVNSCEQGGGIEVPARYKNEGAKTDFLLFVGVEDDSSAGWLAYAGPCVVGECRWKRVNPSEPAEEPSGRICGAQRGYSGLPEILLFGPDQDFCARTGTRAVLPLIPLQELPGAQRELLHVQGYRRGGQTTRSDHPRALQNSFQVFHCQRG